MANAIHDQNTGLTLLCASSADSVTPINIEADPTTKGINVQIVGDDVGVGGGTQYEVDQEAGADDSGTLALVVRDDALTELTPTDGDYTQLRVDSTGNLWVSLGTKLDNTNDSILVYANTAKDGSGTDYVPLVDSNGKLKVVTNGLELPTYDYVSMALSGGDATETYTFKTGGSGGATVATVAIVYTTATREVISTVTKTLP